MAVFKLFDTKIMDAESFYKGYLEFQFHSLNIVLSREREGGSRGSNCIKQQTIVIVMTLIGKFIGGVRNLDFQTEIYYFR